MSENLLNCEIDEANILIIPDIHDSVLMKLELNKDPIILTFMTADKEELSLYLIGVVDFICNNLRKGNITLDFTISSGNEKSFKVLEKLITIPKQTSSKFEEYFNSIKDKILKSELQLVQLNPSYGCEIIALCEKVKYKGRRMR